MEVVRSGQTPPLHGGVVTDNAGKSTVALDERIWVAWLTVRGARVVADSRPDPENNKTREQAERHLNTLLEVRQSVDVRA
jgi:hypothetical protein